MPSSAGINTEENSGTLRRIAAFSFLLTSTRLPVFAIQLAESRTQDDRLVRQICIQETDKHVMFLLADRRQIASVVCRIFRIGTIADMPPEWKFEVVRWDRLDKAVAYTSGDICCRRLFILQV
jgi:hypothetical protein